MAGKTVDFDEAATSATSKDGGRKNERSSVEFPYLDLDTAVDVAAALYQRAGLGSCELDELAAEMHQTISGAFRLKTSAARMFGLIEKDGRSGYKLTELGQEVVNADSEARARAAAFMNVSLYSQIFEKYRGRLLPPAKALEREMAVLGVASKQTDKARQAFERSARQAGFNAQGDDRLVQPRFDRLQAQPIGEPEPLTTAPAPVPTGGGSGGGFHGGGDNKPLQYQLIDLLEQGGMTDEEQKSVWTLINYLARRKRPVAESSESKAASNMSSDAA